MVFFGVGNIATEGCEYADVNGLGRKSLRDFLVEIFGDLFVTQVPP